MSDLNVTAARPHFSITPQLVMGLLIILLGVLFLLDNLGVINSDEYTHYWPLGLMAIGLVKLWHARDGRSGAFGGFIFTIVGLWLLLEELAVIVISFADMWPLLLVFFGAYLVWQGVTGRKRVAAAGHDATATMNAIAVLSGVSKGTSSRVFRGGTLTAVMGGCEVDLRKAAINGEAVVEVFAMWGGIEMRVPEDWTVINHVTPLLGGIDDKTRPPQGAPVHTLVLRGFVIMGGVEVKN